MTNWETITLEQDQETEGIYTLTLNRPEAMNSLNTQMALDLIQCFTYLKEQKDLRVLIYTASGEKSFCVGADLKERKGMTNEQWHRQHDIFEEAYAMIRNFQYPVIAAVNGYALGGGMEMMLSCDLRIIADHAKVGLPEVKIGIIPGVGGTQLLPRAIPVGLAKEFLFRGNQIPAERAKEVGLVNDVVPASELIDKALEISRDIAKNAPLSLKAIKQSVNNGLQTDLNTALTIELDQYYKCANSEDRQEGIMAFNEKRKPNWQGK
ncbi:enoyl-CoA hydratase/isomerase family protein [Halalkalibacter nanhaiisediminis]|uniref:Enoyl-CoA hydratase/carnithine racemase n=1 Tax=Halalkalibacter nanhaiisediminis TaxID=688079 RepID=A0A562QD99_9BACI|nr:enoyl-CoA hydratase-related protein [Halalkalibacter nanhaiisediminis]TWI54737.1 enoyl-CoA hydratase/carnithine racemase [Halalkalibacter nanhaiisediminis]